MALFEGEYKNNPDFEYGTFSLFLSELKKLEKKPGSDSDKIRRAISNAPEFFEKFTKEKKQLQQPGVKFEDVLKESCRLIENVCSADELVLQGIITKDENARKLVLFGERLGGYCAMSKLSSSQIRNVYGQVKKLELILATKNEEDQLDNLSERKLMLIIPRLAYAARKGGAMVKLSEVLKKSIKQVETVGDFMRFSQFFEAILAYHKAYDGQ